MSKSNSRSFAIGGDNGGAKGQNVYLWDDRSTNRNQQWEEVSRGGDFNSYKKRGTNFCLDGDHGRNSTCGPVAAITKISTGKKSTSVANTDSKSATLRATQSMAVTAEEEGKT